jgi:hypothetical protein
LSDLPAFFGTSSVQTASATEKGRATHVEQQVQSTIFIHSFLKHALHKGLICDVAGKDDTCIGI